MTLLRRIPRGYQLGGLGYDVPSLGSKTGSGCQCFGLHARLDAQTLKRKRFACLKNGRSGGGLSRTGRVALES